MLKIVILQVSWNNRLAVCLPVLLQQCWITGMLVYRDFEYVDFIPIIATGAPLNYLVVVVLMVNGRLCAIRIPSIATIIKQK